VPVELIAPGLPTNPERGRFVGPAGMLLVGCLTARLFAIAAKAGRMGIELMFFNRPGRFPLFARSAGLG